MDREDESNVQDDLTQPNTDDVDSAEQREGAVEKHEGCLNPCHSKWYAYRKEYSNSKISS